jgi:hypothetical protein
VAASLGLVRLVNGRYSLTPIAEDYFLESGVAYFGGLLDLTVNNYPVWSVESLKRAVLTDSPQVYGGSEVFKSHEEQAELARAFTRATHSASMAPATAWPDAADLAQNQLMLDIGGGSGAHCIGALHRWPNLKALVFDIAPVCDVAGEFAVRYAHSGACKWFRRHCAPRNPAPSLFKQPNTRESKIRQPAKTR